MNLEEMDTTKSLRNDIAVPQLVCPPMCHMMSHSYSYAKK